MPKIISISFGPDGTPYALLDDGRVFARKDRVWKEDVTAFAVLDAVEAADREKMKGQTGSIFIPENAERDDGLLDDGS